MKKEPKNKEEHKKKLDKRQCLNIRYVSVLKNRYGYLSSKIVWTVMFKKLFKKIINNYF